MRALTQAIFKGSGFCTVLVTHNPEDTVELADRALLLDGNPAEILTEYKIKAPRQSRNLNAELHAMRQALQAAR